MHAHYLRLSVTDKCDMRCIYCTPKGTSALPAGEKLLSKDEIVRIVEIFAQNGVTKLRITGGEPLLRDDLLPIIKAIAHIPGIAKVGITTNGLLLSGLAARLLENGITHINVSLDSLQHGNFRKITGSDNIDIVIKGIQTALTLGFQKIKTNTVVMRGINDCELPAIADLARKWPIDARFIELMPIGHLRPFWKSLYVPAEEILAAIGKPEAIPSDVNSSARLYEKQGYAGRIGIISPISEPFCSTCNRIRVTSRGELITCLRSKHGSDIRPLLSHPNAAEGISDLLSQRNNVSHNFQTTAMSAVGG